MAVVLDTQILIWGGIRELSSDESEPSEKAERARWLIANLQRDNIDIVVPTIVASELAVPLQKEKRGLFLASLSEQFIIKPFDLQAAAIAAQLWQDAKESLGDKKPSRRILSADVKIIATAKAAGAKIFYSNDKGCLRIAKLVMEGRGLPTHQEQLFD